MKIKECPQWIIWTGEDGKFHIDNDLLDEIESIDSPLVAIAITGKYRTGKSYLLNRIAGVKYGELHQHSIEGFDMAATLEPKTKGIWVWLRDHPEDNDLKLLLFDTEGLGDPSKQNSDHDNWIYILAILLSSVVIHNTMGSVGRDIISDLSCMTELSRNLLREEDSGSSTVPRPHFILALRDFTLRMQMDGREITPDDYLAGILKINSTDEEEVRRPRESIIIFFPIRKCFIFERPGNGRQLADLQKLSDEALDEEFREQLKVFLEYIYQTCKPGQEHVKPMNGPIVAGLISSYVKGINNGAVPSMETTFLSLIKGENEKLLKECVDTYYTNLRDEVGFPIEDILKFEELHGIQFAATIKRFTSNSFGDDKYKKSFLESLEVSMEKKHDEFLEESERESTKNCHAWLDPRSKELVENLLEGQYDESDGKLKFDLNLQAIEDEYNNLPGLGYNRGDMWTKFKKDWVTIGINAKWRKLINSAFLPWRTCRGENIMNLIGLIQHIEGEEKKFRIGNIIYSSTGIISAILTITGFALAVPTAGAALGLTIAGTAMGVASGIAGGTHVAVKAIGLKDIGKKASELLKEDEKQFEELKRSIADINHLIHTVNSRVRDVGSNQIAYGLGQISGSIGRLTFDVVDIALDFARVGGYVIAPIVAITSVIDAINIGYSAKALSKDELSNMAKQLEEPLNQLIDGLDELNKWFKDSVPSDLQYLICLPKRSTH